MPHWLSRPALLTPLVLTVLVATSGGAALAATPSPDPTVSPSSTPAGSAAASPPAAGPVATSLVLERSVPAVSFGTAVTLTGRLTRSDGTPVVDAPVQVLSRTLGQDAVVVLTTARTGSDGRLASRFTPRTTSEYALRYGGDALTAPALSSGTVTAVQPRLDGAFDPAGVRLGAAGVLHGILTPAYYGTRLVIRRRFADGSWHPIAVVGIDRGAYSWTVRPGLVGRYVFQVLLPARPAYLPAQTPALALTVDPRDLVQGDIGADVGTLQRRLAAQMMDVGPVDGVFGYDLTHAVLAFQKTQDLPRTGVYDSATRVRLGAPHPVRLRAPSAGRAIEIDLRRQVLFLSQGGVLQRVLDVSTGSGQLYQQDGVTYRATTPLGTFAIERKINDPNHTSPLGVLYRPAFFYQGWALHGSSSVPAYPASHGCVRITDPAMDRLYDLLTIGLPVTVYAG